MPSKGVQVYTYINSDGCEVEYEVPGQKLVRPEQRQFTTDRLEVDKRQLGLLDVTGRFSFLVRRHGQEITRQWCDINTLTGTPDGGTLKAIADQRSIILDDLIVSYGFYDAGSGHTANLPDSHQVYVTVTPNFSRWITDLAPQGSDKANNNKLTRFMLPSSHDIGMNSMQIPNEMVRNGGKAFIQTLTSNMRVFATAADALATPIASQIAPSIIASLSITQKDSLTDILRLGARYFEFRPAHIFDQIRSALPDRLYFMHGPIPGMPYDDFLRDVVSFLVAQPDEIVVVQLRWDGVPAECARPNDDELRDALDAAVRDTAVSVADLNDLHNSSITQLRDANKRLVVLREVNTYSTYDDLANATLDGTTILARFETLDGSQLSSHDLTNIQVQATATNIKDVVIHAVLTSDDNNSVLMATKAICDLNLLPWVRDHVVGRVNGEEGLVVLMNDFFDGATADVAIDVTRQRLL